MQTSDYEKGLALHAAVYCGVPTAVEAFRSAAEVVDAPKPA